MSRTSFLTTLFKFWSPLCILQTKILVPKTVKLSNLLIWRHMMTSQECSVSIFQYINLVCVHVANLKHVVKLKQLKSVFFAVLFLYVWCLWDGFHAHIFTRIISNRFILLATGFVFKRGTMFVINKQKSLFIQLCKIIQTGSCNTVSFLKHSFVIFVTLL